MNIQNKENFKTIEELVIEINNNLNNYQNSSKFMYFYNKYNDIFLEEIFDNCTTYEDYYCAMCEFIARYLTYEIEQNENKKQELEKNIKIAGLRIHGYKFYSYNSKIKELLFVINELEDTKINNAKLSKINYELEINQHNLDSKQKQLDEYNKQIEELKVDVKNTKGISKIFKFNKRLKNQGRLNEIESLKNILEQNMMALEEKVKLLEEQKIGELKNINIDIDELNSQIEKAKQQFEKETSVSYDEYEKEYSNSSVMPYEEKEYKQQLEKIQKELDDNNNDLLEVDNIIKSKQMTK